jgi:hypothetical protein
MMELILYLIARLGESSTYASIATILAFYHVSVNDAQMQQLTLWGGVISAVLGIVLREKGTKSTGQMLNDAALALLAVLKKTEPEPEVLPEHESAQPAAVAPASTPDHPTQTIGVTR